MASPYREAAKLKEQTVPRECFAEQMRLLAKKNSSREAQRQEKAKLKKERKDNRLANKKLTKEQQEDEKINKYTAKTLKNIKKKIVRASKKGQRTLEYCVDLWPLTGGSAEFDCAVSSEVRKILKDDGLRVVGSSFLDIKW